MRMFLILPALVCSAATACDVSKCVAPAATEVSCNSATRFTVCLGEAGCSTETVVTTWSAIATTLCGLPLAPRTKRGLDAPQMKAEEGNLVFAVPSGKHAVYRIGSQDTNIDQIADTASADCAQQVSAAAATLSAATDALESSVVDKLDTVVTTVKNNLEPKIAENENKIAANGVVDAELKTFVGSMKTVMQSDLNANALAISKLVTANEALVARQDASDKCNTEGKSYDSSAKKCVTSHWHVSGGETLKCTAASTGALRQKDGVLSLCDGTKFNKVFDIKRGLTKDDAVVSCSTLKKEIPASKAGYYYVNPDGNKVMKVYCKDGWTLLMKIKAKSFKHIRSNNELNLPVRLDCSECRMSSTDITRFNKAAGPQLFQVDPDDSGYMSWYQYAGSNTDEWPTNLDCSNRGNLHNANSQRWRWILTSWGKIQNARTGKNGDTGTYTGRNHYYPTPYSPEQIFFGTYSGGMRVNKLWQSSGNLEGRGGALWVTDA